LRALECRIVPPSIETRVTEGTAPHVALYATPGAAFLGVAWHGPAYPIAVSRWAPAASTDAVGPFALLAAAKE
jgi:hypothetical protein